MSLYIHEINNFTNQIKKSINILSKLKKKKLIGKFSQTNNNTLARR